MKVMLYFLCDQQEIDLQLEATASKGGPVFLAHRPNSLILPGFEEQITPWYTASLTDIDAA